MIIGIGVDIIEIERIAQAIQRHGNTFIDKLFTKKEQAQKGDKQPHLFYAGRFAAKEAVVKALGTGFRGITWKDIEIFNDSRGKPIATLSESQTIRFENPKLLITISHSKEHACAFCVWEK
jgi:holo-[acyl-carrier protein] synthase